MSCPASNTAWRTEWCCHCMKALLPEGCPLQVPLGNVADPGRCCCFSPPSSLVLSPDPCELPPYLHRQCTLQNISTMTAVLSNTVASAVWLLSSEMWLLSRKSCICSFYLIFSHHINSHGDLLATVLDSMASLVIKGPLAPLLPNPSHLNELMLQLKPHFQGIH